MGYLYLAIAIVAEVAGTSALKPSEGFRKLGPSLVVLAGFGVAFFFMSLSLRTIPVGIAYAIWAGCGIALITVIGAVLFRQIPDSAAVIGIGLIIAGVVVLSVFSRMAAH